MSRPHRDRDPERGAGLVATMFAVPLVLTLALAGAQVLLRLHATAAVRAIAGDAAREAAVTPGAMSATADHAVRSLRADLGAAGRDADIAWALVDGTITVRVRVDPPRVLPLLDLGPLGAPIVTSGTARYERWA